MTRFLIPAQEARIEIRVSNSRFIATAAPAFTVDEAKAFIARIKAEFADATHNVTAYLLGHGASLTAHCNDDGEPSGTAGRPALAVLQGSGLGDIVVVVSRYFGGTKLGTGGLVRAYGDAVRQVLAVLPRAEKAATFQIALTAPYALYNRVRQALDTLDAQVIDEQFAADVTLTARIAARHLPEFQEGLQELSGGTVSAQILSSDTAILPVAEPRK